MDYVVSAILGGTYRYRYPSNQRIFCLNQVRVLRWPERGGYTKREIYKEKMQ